MKIFNSVIFKRKFLAIFLLLNILNQLFLPSLTFALTSGPTSPEASSFEPVDTTDMVNPLTGDFTYNIPLLEVPGPEGSYPLSLSYHSGIQPNEEASWVGLGWNLNPGAITRNVNGYPDDFADVNNIVRSYWSGGSTKTIGVDVGVGLGPASVNFGLSFSQDTYLGFGVGSSIGVGGSIGGKGSPFTIGITVGTSPYGESYAGLNIGLNSGKGGEAGMALGTSLGVSTNFNSVNVGAGASISYVSNGQSSSLMGASMSSGGGDFSAKVGGLSSSVHNANQGRIQTESSGWSFSLPLPVISVGVSYNYTRYWSDETQRIMTNGTLYSVNSASSSADFDSKAYDTYRLLDPQHGNFTENPDPDRVIGGTYPDFDNYNVTAQGLAGSMRPFAYQNTLYSQNKLDNQNHNNDIKTRIVGANRQTNSTYQFRFLNDFSNSFRQEAKDFNDSEFNFDNPVYGNSDGEYGYSSSRNQLAGSKHVEWFTNAEIASGVAGQKGFIKARSGAYETYSYDKRIGGFMITNASGVTYHYALPAYSFNEYTYTEEVNSPGERWNTLCKPNAYAYTWYLTAVTGPDYVDRNNNGFADAEDWGYWVEFNYGKWASNYSWRNPSEDFHKDIDQDFRNFSVGQKEVYYLNTVKTRTHTAVFVKELRADAKSITYFREGGFDVIPETNETGTNYNFRPRPARRGTENGTTRPPVPSCRIPNSSRFPISSLKLKEIVLLKNEDFEKVGGDSISSLSENYNFSTTEYGDGSNRSDRPTTIQYTNGNNVIDVFDIRKITDFNSTKLNSIEFNYDYSLSKETPNSFDETGSIFSIPKVSTINMPRLGKLTLNSIEFAGKNGTKITPPISFEYDLDVSKPENNDNIRILPNSSVRQIQLGDASKFNEGDLLRFSVNQVEYYLVILKKEGSLCKVQYLGKVPAFQNERTAQAFRTKNPPYDKDRYDMWGLYKSDYEANMNNENIKRTTTPISAKNVDAWSLRQINSILGSHINIDYESDQFSKSVLAHNTTFIINGASIEGPNIRLAIKPESINGNPEEIYAQGRLIDVHLFIESSNYDGNGNSTYCSRIPEVYSTLKGNNTKARVVSSGPTWVLIRHDDMLNYLTDHDYVRHRVLTGNIDADNPSINFGGGLRVSSISTSDPVSGVVNRTRYNYNFNLGNQDTFISSGVTSYEPVVFPASDLPLFRAESNFPCVSGGDGVVNKFKNEYKAYLYKKLSYLLALSREVPGPGVMYSNVTVQDETRQADGTVFKSAGKSLYEYEVFNEGMIGKKEYAYKELGNSRVSNLALKDYTSRIGKLKRTVTYDDHGDKLTEVINHYLHDQIAEKSFSVQSAKYENMLAAYQYQGLIKERYGDARTMTENGNVINKTVMSGRDTYPVIQTGTTQIDYKNGVKVEQTNLGFDFYSGAVAKAVNSDSYGNRFLTEVTSAYKIYPALGLKINQSNGNTNKNMLSQKALSVTYKADFYNNPVGVISATATTWSNNNNVLDPNGALTSNGQDKVWRMKSSYTWMPEGAAQGNITPLSSFQSYFGQGSSNPSWKNTAEVKLYDVYSKTLEITDLNKNSTVNKMGYKNAKVVMTGNPAVYDELAFSGAEEGFSGNGLSLFGGKLTSGSANVVQGIAHTGERSLLMGAGAKGFNYGVPLSKLDRKRNYSVAAWVKPQSGDISGVRLYYQLDGGQEIAITPGSQKNAAGWYLIEMIIPASALQGNTITTGCKNNGTENVYVDDFRFQPANGQSNAYVYDTFTGKLTYVLDNNNLYTKFEYDQAGRLIKTYKEVLGKTTVPLIKETVYNYGLLSKGIWKDTGVKRCQQENNNNTGYLEKEQKDLNPYSSTYNQNRWVQDQISPSCISTVYARLESKYIFSPLKEQYEFVIAFYFDPLCSIPIDLGVGTTFNYQIEEGIHGGNIDQDNVYNRQFQVAAGAPEVSLGVIVTGECVNHNNPSEGPVTGEETCTSRIISLKPGQGYIVVQ
jgi:hypothetical protein